MEGKLGETSLFVRKLIVVVEWSVLAVLVTSVVVSVKVDTVDSIVLVGTAVVTDEDSGLVDGDVVDVSWQMGPL